MNRGNDPVRTIARFRIERWEAKVAAVCRAALAEQRTRAHSRITAGSADPFDLATWEDTVDRHVRPVAVQVLGEAADRIRGMAPAEAALYLDHGGTLADQVEAMVAATVRVGADVAARLEAALAGHTPTPAGDGSVTAAGPSKADLAGRIGAVFGGGDGQMTAVARQVNQYANRGTFALANALHGSGTTMSKTWVTVGDDKVRDWHDDADGQTVAVDEPFDVDGEAMWYPGDPNGSDENVVNCRCDLDYQLDSGTEDAGDTGEAAVAAPDLEEATA